MAMVSSSTTSTAPTSTATSGPRPTYTQVCTPHSGGNVAFPRDTGVDAINRSWSWSGGSLTIPTYPLYVIESMGGHFIFQGNITWSANQNGCNAKQSNYQISSDVWTTLFTHAMDNCKFGKRLCFVAGGVTNRKCVQVIQTRHLRSMALCR